MKGRRKPAFHVLQATFRLQPTAAGDCASFDNLIDDTEETQWERTGSTDVAGTQITVDPAGTQPRTVNRVQVSTKAVVARQRSIIRCCASA